jgi:hypothetical protein
MRFDRLADLVAIRPLTGWTGPRTADPRRSPFNATWSATVSLLAREISHLSTGNGRAVLEVDVREDQLRNDGLPYANARIADPAVVLTILSVHGALRYPCDTFGSGKKVDGWQHNVRAIALALEALRTVDRYGVTRGGEQYAGWKQLAAGGPSTSDAGKILTSWAKIGGVVDPAEDADLLRAARRASHPDSPTGSHGAFLAVQDAAATCGFL